MTSITTVRSVRMPISRALRTAIDLRLKLQDVAKGRSMQLRLRRALTSEAECKKFSVGAKVTWLDGNVYTVSGHLKLNVAIGGSYWRVTVLENKKTNFNPKELTLV